jgi:hypothetical protein
MDQFLIEPRFNALRGALFFETTKLNALVSAEYYDNFDVYQRLFQMYSWMTMNDEHEFVMHYMHGNSLVWQPHKSCAWDPVGKVTMGQRTITPCPAKVNQQFCYDEYMDSSFKTWLNWSTGGPAIGFKPAGIAATNMLTRSLVENATRGYLATLVAGKLHNVDTVVFNPATPTDIRSAFVKTASTCRGWIPLLRAMSQEAGLAHLDTLPISSSDISNDGKKYTGNILTVYDALVEQAPQRLQDAIIEGGIPGFDGAAQTLMLVALPEYRAIYNQMLAQKNQAVQNDPRITVREFPSAPGQTPIQVYYIDKTAIIPVNQTGVYDQYLPGTSHFAYLTVSGNVQLGGNFANIPRSRDGNVAIMIQQSQDAEDYGMYKMLAHSLMSSAINDVDYITGGYLYATPS